MRLTDCVTRWINRREINRAPSTISGYRRLCRKYIEPFPAGSTELDQLDEDDMLDLLRPLITAGHTRQAQLLQILVTAVLRDALRHREIMRNPMDGVDRVKHESAFTAWLTVEQARQLLASSRDADDEYYLAWLLMLCCGLRRGEMLGLQWSDVDEVARTLHVSRQRVRVDGQILETRPKSARSTRPIPLDDRIITEIRLRRKPGRYILEAATPESLAVALDAAIARAQVPRVTPHGLRHTMAATAASEGVPIKTLQTLMGHAHYTTTADIYAHVNENSRRTAAATVAAATIPARLEIA